MTFSPEREANAKLQAVLQAVRELGGADPDVLLALALAAIDTLEDAGDRDAAFAANILRGSRRRPGREAIDDLALLRQVRDLHRLGRGREAIGIVARGAASDPSEVDTIARRLRDKWSKIKRRK